MYTQEKGTLEYVKVLIYGDYPTRGQFITDDYKKELVNFAQKNISRQKFNMQRCQQGGVAFHHGYTWHGSGINTSQDNRRAVVAHCVPSDAEFHPTNIGGTARIYKKYKKINSNELEESFFLFYGQRRVPYQCLMKKNPKKKNQLIQTI